MAESSQQPNLKRSLVLAGGGVRLAYHAGVLIALEEAGLTFAHVDGTSGGIFGTAMLASGIPPHEQAERWRKLRLRGFIEMLPLGSYLSQKRMRAFGGSDGIRRKVFPALGISVEKIRENSAIESTFNVCNFSQKTLETIDGAHITTDHLIAGMSLAVFSPAIRLEGNWYTDAIWIRDANLGEAVRRGAEDIWLIWCIGNAPSYLNGVFNQYVHMIEISANAGVFSELQQIKQLNAARAEGGQAPLKLHLIKPPFPLPLDPDFFLNRIDADTLINMGYADAKRYLQDARPLSLDNIPATTAMPDPGLTIHFRQQFSGILEGKDIRLPVTVRLGFFIRETEPGLSCYASVEPGGAEAIPAYNPTVTREDRGRWECRFSVIYQGEVREVRLLYQLDSYRDFLWALDGKTALVSVVAADGTPLAAGRCRQKATARLKNRWHLHVSGAQQMPRRRRQSRQLLRRLFT